ncbi:MAG TPA: caspase family protein [Chitinophagaceae bacterium]|nr:caspase family protein [Chitinophagaceae bacterium]
MKKAFLTGINQYPDPRNVLRGCINDIHDMAEFLQKERGFDEANIRLLQDAAATKENILNGLQWLLQDAAAGDQLFFQYSGHGAQMPTLSTNGEPDRLDEVICPYDFNWTDATALKDKEFNKLFASIPAGVSFIWVSDSCHSQDLSREVNLADNGIFKMRSMQPPPDIAQRTIKVKASPKLKVQELAAIAPALNLALISGCKSNQESADAVFKKRANGALTYFLLQALHSANGKTRSLRSLVTQVNEQLRKIKYPQQPQVEGNKTLMEGVFF